MMKIDELLPLIRPRNLKVSDKYSANLYRWMKDHHWTTVLLYKPDGRYFLTFSNWREDDWKCISGTFIRDILNSHGAEGGCYLHRLWADCEEVTDWFWKEYLRIGRCVFDPGHDGWMLGAENRFTEIHNTRRCNWCGRWQSREIVKRVRIERLHRWVPA